MTKNLKISLIVLVTLIGLYFLNSRSQGKFESTSTAIFTDDTEDIFKILIQKGEEAIELARVDTIWKISGNDTLVAKPRSIEDLFDKILKVNRSTIISENPDNYGKYSIDDILNHNEKDKNLGMLLSEATYNPELPTPIGIIYQEEKETYNSLMEKHFSRLGLEFTISGP